MSKFLKKVFSVYATIGIPLLYLYTIYLAYAFPHGFQTSFIVIILGIIISIVGCILWVLSYFNLGRSFGVLPQKQKRVTRGIYKYLKHPMYIGIYLTLFGLSVSNGSLVALIFLNIILLPILFIRANFEDEQLL